MDIRTATASPHCAALWFVVEALMLTYTHVDTCCIVWSLFLSVFPEIYVVLHHMYQRCLITVCWLVPAYVLQFYSRSCRQLPVVCLHAIILGGCLSL